MEIEKDIPDVLKREAIRQFHHIHYYSIPVRTKLHAKSVNIKSSEKLRWCIDTCGLGTLSPFQMSHFHSFWIAEKYGTGNYQAKYFFFFFFNYLQFTIKHGRF